MSNELAISISAVKKTWCSVYDRAAEHLPDSILNHDDREDHRNGDRGKQKKQRLLAYLREHHEELRPYSRKTRKKSQLRTSESSLLCSYSARLMRVIDFKRPYKSDRSRWLVEKHARWAAPDADRGRFPALIVEYTLSFDDCLDPRTKGRWYAQGDDLRTFLAEFVAIRPQAEVPTQIEALIS